MNGSSCPMMEDIGSCLKSISEDLWELSSSIIGLFSRRSDFLPNTPTLDWKSFWNSMSSWLAWSADRSDWKFLVETGWIKDGDVVILFWPLKKFSSKSFAISSLLRLCCSILGTWLANLLSIVVQLLWFDGFLVSGIYLGMSVASVFDFFGLVLDVDFLLLNSIFTSTSSLTLSSHFRSSMIASLCSSYSLR